jgi:Tol biopolymer transport system component
MGDIFVMNADGSGQAQLTPTVLDARDPAWSPDGLTIVYSRAQSCAAEDCLRNLFAMNADGSGTPLQLSVKDGREAAWSPAGDRLAVTEVEPGWDWGIPTVRWISALRRDGAGFIRIGTGWHPTWQP